MRGHFSLMMFMIGFYGTTAQVVAPLITTVGCIDDKDAQRNDSYWDFHEWDDGVEHWSRTGRQDLKICDQIIEVRKPTGKCIHDSALVCELTTRGIVIGAASIDTVGGYNGKVHVLLNSTNDVRWATTSETKCHGHKFRVQFFGRKNIFGKILANLTCGVAKGSDDDDDVDDHGSACRFNNYTYS